MFVCSLLQVFKFHCKDSSKRVKCKIKSEFIFISNARPAFFFASFRLLSKKIIIFANRIKKNLTMTYAIIGTGAIGGYYGAKLARSG